MISFHQIFLRLLCASALGAAIGGERAKHHRRARARPPGRGRETPPPPAGVRPSMFVCMATALFTILSVEISRIYGDSSSTRIASNIVQGIGFLGAGAILKDNATLVAMPTAATIFAEAAIGMAAGAGLYAIAGSAT